MDGPSLDCYGWTFIGLLWMDLHWTAMDGPSLDCYGWTFIGLLWMDLHWTAMDGPSLDCYGWTFITYSATRESGGKRCDYWKTNMAAMKASFQDAKLKEEMKNESEIL